MDNNFTGSDKLVFKTGAKNKEMVIRKKLITGHLAVRPVAPEYRFTEFSGIGRSGIVSGSGSIRHTAVGNNSFLVRVYENYRRNIL